MQKSCQLVEMAQHREAMWIITLAATSDQVQPAFACFGRLSDEWTTSGPHGYYCNQISWRRIEAQEYAFSQQTVQFLESGPTN